MTKKQITNKRYQKFFLLLVCSVLIFNGLIANAKEEKNLVKSEEGVVETKKPSQFYELVHSNLRPDVDEFYLTTVYGTQENPRALIKRSTNRRAGELFNVAVEYGLGDKISTNLIIREIDFVEREVIVEDEVSNDFYGLKLSYGNAKSRLIKKPNYKSSQNPDDSSLEQEPPQTDSNDDVKASKDGNKA